MKKQKENQKNEMKILYGVLIALIVSLFLPNLAFADFLCTDEKSPVCNPFLGTGQGGTAVSNVMAGGAGDNGGPTITSIGTGFNNDALDNTGRKFAFPLGSNGGSLQGGRDYLTLGTTPAFNTVFIPTTTFSPVGAIHGVFASIVNGNKPYDVLAVNIRKNGVDDIYSTLNSGAFAADGNLLLGLGSTSNLAVFHLRTNGGVEKSISFTALDTANFTAVALMPAAPSSSGPYDTTFNEVGVVTNNPELPPGFLGYFGFFLSGLVFWFRRMFSHPSMS